MKLYPHQNRALSQMHDGCILCGETGTGKSITALAYFRREASDPNLIIITTAKKRDSHDWEFDCALMGIDLDYVSIDSWNNIGKYKDRHGCFFIFDEQRLIGSGSWVKSFLKIAEWNRWILLTATPGDTWMDYIPVFLANGFYKNRTQFINEHVVYRPFARFPKVARYTDPGKLIRYRSQILVDAPFKKHTVRHDHEIGVSFDGPIFRRAFIERWHPYENRPLRDIAETFLVMRKIVNSDPSRIESLKDLLQKHSKIIVFYNFDYELYMLRTLSDELAEDGVRTAEWNGHRHEEIPEGLKWLYLVQYQAGSEAWNCTQTDTIVFYSQTYSYRQLEQAKGRIDRMNTQFTDLHYYHLISGAYIDKVIARSLGKKKDFNERDYSEMEEGSRVPGL